MFFFFLGSEPKKKNTFSQRFFLLDISLHLLINFRKCTNFIAPSEEFIFITLNKDAMPTSIYPCLWFDGQAKEAATFYADAFGRSSILKENPMVVLFEIEGKVMMALNGGPDFKMNPSISMMVHRLHADDCRKLWSKLSEGGKILMPLDKYDWSELYGWVQDKYGFSWQIMASNNENITPTLLFTGPHLGEALEALKFYTSIFPGSAIDFESYYPKESPYAGNLNYAAFHLNQYPMAAMDGPNDHNYTFSEGVSLVVNCENQQEIDFFWQKFCNEGGAESMCGWCKDKFGVSWQVVPANMGDIIANPVNGKRAMQKLMGMKKIDIQALENA